MTPPLHPQRAGFLLLPGFSLMSYAAAVEPLRAANLLSGKALYTWLNIALAGTEAVASNGVAIRADAKVGDKIDLDWLLVCAGGNPAVFADTKTFAWLRAQARRGTVLGGISGGAYALARAGLLDGFRATIHWDHLPAFTEQFPRIAVERGIFVIDRARMTCAGGVAAVDLMHALIERDHGAALAAAVDDWYLHGRARLGSRPQRLSVAERYGTGNAKLARVLASIEKRIEAPPSRAVLAREAGISLRQLERLFAAHLHITAARHILKLRLERARQLLRQSPQPIVAIATSCGFASASHFSTAYRRQFGVAPRADRDRQVRRP
jgi:transcriptional regulator GlxA family with amidase domain